MAGRPRILTADEEKDLYDRYMAGGISQLRLSEEYGISQACAWVVLKRQGWVPSGRSAGPRRPYKPSGTTGKDEAGYRVQEVSGLLRRCGTCQHRIQSTERSRDCLVVAGPVELRGVCDNWQLRVKKDRWAA